MSPAPDLPVTKNSRWFCPAVFLSAQSPDQLLGSVQFLLTHLDVMFQFFFLVRHQLELVIQSLEFIDNLSATKTQLKNEH